MKKTLFLCLLLLVMRPNGADAAVYGAGGVATESDSLSSIAARGATTTEALTVGGLTVTHVDGVNDSIDLYDQDGDHRARLQAADNMAADIDWSLPDADGTAEQVLKTDGSGVLSWVNLPRVVQILVTDFTTDTSTGDGQYYFVIPNEMGGLDLTSVHARVITAGTTNTTIIQVHNVTAGVDVLSTRLTIDSTETGSDTAAAPAVINTTNDDATAYQLWRIDVDQVSTTPGKGLIVTLGFS